MNRPSIRARVAIGSAIGAVAVLTAVGSLTATTEPPPSGPPSSDAVASSEPVSSAPTLDPDREVLVDQVVAAGETVDFTLDRECIAGLVAHLPDADVALVAADIESASEAISTIAPIPFTVPDTDVSSETDAPATSIVFDDPSAPVGSSPAMSPAAEAFGQQVITCVHGDADPVLVEEVLTLFAADEASADFDMTCVANMLSTFEDETLQQIIDLAVAEAEEADASAATMPDMTDPTIEDALSLLVCSPELVTDATGDTQVTDVVTAVTETTTA